MAFLESDGFEDAIRNAISIGGDSDTIAAITGAVAEAAYRIPDAFVTRVDSHLTAPLLKVCQNFASALAEP